MQPPLMKTSAGSTATETTLTACPDISSQNAPQSMSQVSLGVTGEGYSGPSPWLGVPEGQLGVRQGW